MLTTQLDVSWEGLVPMFTSLTIDRRSTQIFSNNSAFSIHLRGLCSWSDSIRGDQKKTNKKITWYSALEFLIYDTNGDQHRQHIEIFLVTNSCVWQKTLIFCSISWRREEESPSPQEWDDTSHFMIRSEWDRAWREREKGKINGFWLFLYS